MDFEQPKSITEQVCESLVKAIIEGKLKPGDPLTEAKLNEQFGISRAPIREAFRTLEEKDFVTIIPRKGTFVKQVTKRDIEENFPIRALLEGYAARIATGKMTKKDLEKFSVCIKNMEHAAANNDFLAFKDSHYEFHRIYIKASDSNLLIKLLEDLLNKSLWYRFAFLYFHEAYSYSLRKHKEILRLFTRKDKDTYSVDYA